MKQQTAWEAFTALAGLKDPMVSPWVRGRRVGFGSDRNDDSERSSSLFSRVGHCAIAEERAMGYWPMPWVEMPPGGIPFDPFAAITTPAANGVETEVLQFKVPYGYDGIINGITNLFTGPGFVEGSGDLIWRIRVGQPQLQGRPQRNYSSIRQTMGDLTSPREVPGGIRIIADQFVEYSVVHSLGSPIVPAGTRIICNIQGYYWPRGASSMG